MKLAGVKAGDIVRCDIKGRQFLATVNAKTARYLSITPVCRGVTYRSATARETVEHWSRRKNGTG